MGEVAGVDPLAVAMTEFAVFQMPCSELPEPVKVAMAANTMNPRSSVYSVKPCPQSSWRRNPNHRRSLETLLA